MTTNADAFERAWGSHVQGVDSRVDPELGALVAVAEGLRSFRTAVQAPPADAAWARLSEELGRELVPLDSVVVPLRRRGPRRRMVFRVAAAAVAMFAAIAMVSLRATPGSFLYPLRTGLEETALLLAPEDGALHLHVAEARLGDLVHSLRDGPQSAAPGLARALMAQRAAATAHGESVSGLDDDVRAQVPPALSGVAFPVVQQVRAILGDLLPPVAASGDIGSGPTAGGTDGGGGHDGSGSNEGPGGSSGGGGSESGDGGSGSGDSGTGSGDTGTGSGDGGGSSDGGDSGGSQGTGGSGDGGSGSGSDSGTGDGGSGSSGDAGSGSGSGSGSDGSGSGSDGGGSGSSGDGGTGGGGSGD